MRPLVVLLWLTGVAAAHPPPDPGPEPSSWRETPAVLEWSTWVRAGFGLESGLPEVAARSIHPIDADRHTTWTFALGTDVTLPLPSGLRIGPWVELQGNEPAAGAELLVTRAPSRFKMFFYNGEGVWIVRAGTTPSRTTGALGFGYRCPWKLWGPYSRNSRYEIGARIVLAASRSNDHPEDWQATLGLEVEPIGALRYLLGIESLY
jgi:hypothetical protein